MPQKWEYGMVTVGVLETMHEELNQAGEKGWEAVSALEWQDTDRSGRPTKSLLVLLKRPKETASS